MVIRVVALCVLGVGCFAESVPEPGPEQWVEEALALEGGCELDDDCSIYTHDCMPTEVAEYLDFCTIAVPNEFDTSALDAVMERIRTEMRGDRYADGRCGGCNLAFPLGAQCREGECLFDPSGI